MRGLLIPTLSAIAVLWGCAEPLPRSPVVSPTSEAPPAAVVPPAPPTATPSPVEPDKGQGATPAPPAPPDGNASVAASNPPVIGRSPPKGTPSSPEQAATPAKPPVAVPAPVQPPASPPLDLAALEQRLRDTHAIGVFTKLTLRNQVNDLLDEFRQFHDGKINVPLAELRQRYEQLLLKVITLLQDADGPLARAVSSSREAIWGVLVDPKTFAKT
jgi:hypothetical protein